MKKALTILFFIPIFTFGQKSIVSTTKTNVLYVGIENPIKIAVDKLPCEYFSLKCLTKYVELSGNNCEFLIKPHHTGLARFQIINKQDSSIIDTFNIKIIKIPDPKFDFHRVGFENNNICLDYITASSEILKDFEVNLIVKSFNIYAKRDTSLIFELSNDGQQYTKKVLHKIEKCSSEDLLYIGNVWVEIDGKTNVYYAGLHCKIKNCDFCNK